MELKRKASRRQNGLELTKVLVTKIQIEKDVKEFEEEVVEGLEIVYVKTMTQVIKEAFVH